MDDFLRENFVTLLSAGISALVACLAFVASWFRSRKIALENKQLKTDLNKARAAMVSCICPECGRRIYLRDLNFELPDGSLDNNLNGVSDDIDAREI